MPSETSDCSIHSKCSIRSDSSRVSNTSTLEYDHEPYEQYRSRVEELCHLLWPSATEDFIIERLRGGSFNRIIGITIRASNQEAEDRYILRIRRKYSVARPEREAVIQRYLQQHSSIPVAEIVFLDPTRNNPLDSPYVVQKRLPGTPLLEIWKTLTFEQQRMVTRDLGKIIVAERAIKSNFPGKIELASDCEACAYDIQPFNVSVDVREDYNCTTSPESVAPYRGHTSPQHKQPIVEMYLDQFTRWVAGYLRFNPYCQFWAEDFRPLIVIAREMDAIGLFNDVEYCLCHLDFEPRNIMVDVNSDGSAIISGILDWDSAAFAPEFVACKPPSWIWAWNDEDDEDELEANDTPATPEQQELKCLFEEIVGPKYLTYSYQTEYRFARKLFTLATEGMKQSHIGREAEDLFKDWRERYLEPEHHWDPIQKRTDPVNGCNVEKQDTDDEMKLDYGITATQEINASDNDNIPDLSNGEALTKEEVTSINDERRNYSSATSMFGVDTGSLREENVHENSSSSGSRSSWPAFKKRVLTRVIVYRGALKSRLAFKRRHSMAVILHRSAVRSRAAIKKGVSELVIHLH